MFIYFNDGQISCIKQLSDTKFVLVNEKFNYLCHVPKFVELTGAEKVMAHFLIGCTKVLSLILEKLRVHLLLHSVSFTPYFFTIPILELFYHELLGIQFYANNWALIR